jgi:ATP-dependent RNA helicase HelY
VYESRVGDESAQPRLPQGPAREAIERTMELWMSVRDLERDHSVDFQREPDLGFAWAAYRWARGARLEAVLTEAADLTPGDFVRAVKQLLDLLDQIAAAAGGDLGVVARNAMAALRRGVVAYTAVAD